MEGRRARQHGDRVPRNVRQRRLHVEHRLRHHGRAAHQAGDDARLVAEGVEERVHDQVAVALTQAGQLAPHLVAAQCLGVRDHRALGPAGGTGGEDDVGGVLGPDAGRPLADLPRAGTASPPARKSFQVRKARRASSPAPPPSAGAAGRAAGRRPVTVARGPPQRGDVRGAEERAGDEEQPGAGCARRTYGRLRALEAGVQRDQHGAGASPRRARRRSSRGCSAPRSATRSPGSTPAAMQARRGALDALAELGVRRRGYGRRRPPRARAYRSAAAPDQPRDGCPTPGRRAPLRPTAPPRDSS